ncbi:MAG: hypothetical protein LBB98_07930 [Treponema sp.]|nr:hypothetical protein [Treponema sp.]
MKRIARSGVRAGCAQIYRFNRIGILWPTFINMPPYWQQIVKGAIIIAAVALDIRKYLTKR